VQTILFIELLGGIGDVLIALPAIQALGRAYPQAKLTVLTFAPGGELITSDPLIHAVVCLDRQQNHAPHLVRNAVEALLKRDRFDLIVSDTNYGGIDVLLQQSHTSRVVTNLWRSPPPDQKVDDRFLHILQAEGLITPADIAPAQLHLLPAEPLHMQQQLGTIAQPLVVLYPDAGMAIKRWSTANFVRVGQALQQQYNATLVVPVGSDPEQSAQIVEAMGGTALVWAQGTLRELAALMATAALVIAADTGPARIAAALQTPTMTLFGPSWHDRYGQPAPHVNLQGYPDCPERNIGNFTMQRCWDSGECPFDRWQTCLEDISPAQVLAAAAPFLQPSDFNIERSPPKLEMPSLKRHHLTSELETPSLKRHHLTSELETPSLERHHLTSELETLSLGLQQSSSPLPTPHSPLPTPHSPLPQSPMVTRPQHPGHAARQHWRCVDDQSGFTCHQSSSARSPFNLNGESRWVTGSRAVAVGR